jgi:hypothetical protein
MVSKTPDPRTAEQLEEEAIHMLELVGPHSNDRPEVNRLWAELLIGYIILAAQKREEILRIESDRNRKIALPT